MVVVVTGWRIIRLQCVGKNKCENDRSFQSSESHEEGEVRYWQKRFREVVDGAYPVSDTDQRRRVPDIWLGLELWLWLWLWLSLFT